MRALALHRAPFIALNCAVTSMLLAELEMLANSNYLDPWLQTVQLLSRISADVDADCLASNSQQQTVTGKSVFIPITYDQFSGASIRVVERMGSRTITVSWCDSTMCHYPAQIWEMVVATRAGRCAISNVAVKRGDHVFRPRSRGLKPVNAAAIITVDAVEDALAEQFEQLA